MEIKNNNRQALAFLPSLLILLQSLLYGFGDPISKIAFDAVPVYTLLTIRYLIAFLLLALFGIKHFISDLKKTKISVWLPSSLCLAGCYLLGNVALALTAATSVAFLRSLSTVMTPFLALIAFKKRIGRREIPIQILVVVGLYLLCGHGGLSGFGWGEILSLAAALLMACALVFGKEAMSEIRPLTLTAAQAGVSALLALLCALLFDGGFHSSGATPTVWGIILYLAIGCTAAGYLLQNAALKAAPAKTVALIQCACPVLTAVFSFLILGERLTAAGLIGSAIILFCVVSEVLITDDEQ